MSEALDLDALAALAAAATPGPWLQELYRDGELLADGTGRTIFAEDAEGFSTLEIHAETTGDAAFIAASRSAVPELVAEVRRLREFAAWVVSLDDVEGPGADARRTVRLNDIVTRAAGALAAPAD